MKNLANWPRSTSFWAFTALLCIVLEAVALFYQYKLEYYPCVLCIHVRMLLFALLLMALLALLWRHARYPLFWLAGVFWAKMLERSWQLFATENGWTAGECSMQSGLPDWIPLEQWMPWLFQIHEPCGVTPYLLFNISMAQALLGLSAVILLLMIAAVLAPLFKSKSRY